MVGNCSALRALYMFSSILSLPHLMDRVGMFTTAFTIGLVTSPSEWVNDEASISMAASKRVPEHDHSWTLDPPATVILLVEAVDRMAVCAGAATDRATVIAAAIVSACLGVIVRVS